MTRSSLFIITISICASILGAAAILAAAPAKNASRTNVIADERAGTVRILAGGREIVVIDETGLYVSGDMAYTGTIMDGAPVHLREGRHGD